MILPVPDKQPHTVLEELARHLGHADLMREELDGATGD
jgi:hypothetical protein